MKIAIIGGGAAGFFAAINIMKMEPSASVTIYEASPRPLAKVAVSGGGRCNLTNTFEDVKSYASLYPRGDKVMSRALKMFDHEETFDWFETNGVALTIQDDGCVFPYSQDSQEIINTFLRLADELAIDIKMSHKVSSIAQEGDGFKLTFTNDQQPCELIDAVVVTTGGSPQREGLDMLSSLPISIVEPVPSLFTFNIPNSPITEFMGAVVEHATVGLRGSRFKASGALLITHWGVSGPAILKLSSYAARFLEQREYCGTLYINWVGDNVEANIHSVLNRIIEENSQKLVTSVRPYDMPSRLWSHLLDRAEISQERRWAELGRKGLNRIVSTLMADEYQIKGKSHFKEEFVTCGGVSLDSINPITLECRECKNLYFAGEVLDIDAITGGFNLQAAWSTGYVVADALANKICSKKSLA